jgi:hypothetical protein
VTKPCKVWTGCTDGEGYGVKSHNGSRQLVHRIAYVEAKGITLNEIVGKVVRHTCDNPPCIEPEHLLLGTQADNMRDMAERGRARNANTLLTSADVSEIRNRLSMGEHQQLIGDLFGVSRKAISDIACGRRWKGKE